MNKRKTIEKPIPAERLLSNKEAARILGLHHESLAKMRRSGRGPRYIKWGRTEARVHYTMTLLAEWMSENAVEPKVA